MVRASPTKCRPASALLARRQDGMHNEGQARGRELKYTARTQKLGAE